MLNIRIKQLNFKYDKCIKNINMDIKDNSIIGVSGNLANEFINSLAGNNLMDGDVVLDYISMKAEHEEYVKKVRLLTAKYRKQLNGKNLKVRDYINLVQVLDNVYDPLDSNLVLKLNLNNMENLHLCDLDEAIKLKIEFMTSLLKKPKLLLIEDFFELLDQKIKSDIYICLKSYVRHGNICLMASKDILLLNEFTEQIFYINDQLA